MTDHRDRAEQWLASAAENLSGEHTTADATTGTLHALLAIHEEQQAQTGLLTDLRGAIDDLAEVLRGSDFGWTVLGEGQVAVDRDDLGLALGYVPNPEGSWACRRLHAALDAATNPYARQEADDDRD